jgi:hypothetical protein
MRNAVSGLLVAGGLCLPLAAYAGEGKEIFFFLWAGGAVGIPLGLGLYALFALPTAALVRSGAALGVLLALYTLVLFVVERWAFGWINLALGPYRTSAGGTLAPELHNYVLAVVLLAALIAGGALLIWWRRRQRYRHELAVEEELRGW